MKNILLILFMFLSLVCHSQKIVIVEINAEWNLDNSSGIKEVDGIEVQFARLEDQPISIKKVVKSVPLLVLQIDGRTIQQWQAGIDLKLKVTKEDIKKAIARYEKNR